MKRLDGGEERGEGRNGEGRGDEGSMHRIKEKWEVRGKRDRGKGREQNWA